MVGTAVREEGIKGGGKVVIICFNNRNGSTRRVEEKGNHRRKNTTLIDICSTSIIAGHRHRGRCAIRHLASPPGNGAFQYRARPSFPVPNYCSSGICIPAFKNCKKEKRVSQVHL